MPPYDSVTHHIVVGWKWLAAQLAKWKFYASEFYSICPPAEVLKNCDRKYLDNKISSVEITGQMVQTVPNSLYQTELWKERKTQYVNWPIMKCMHWLSLSLQKDGSFIYIYLKVNSPFNHCMPLMFPVTLSCHNEYAGTPALGFVILKEDSKLWKAPSEPQTTL